MIHQILYLCPSVVNKPVYCGEQLQYQWLEIAAYENFSSLVQAVENILKNFGTEYTINFA
jgi:hypothetical protein